MLIVIVSSLITAPFSFFMYINVMKFLPVEFIQVTSMALFPLSSMFNKLIMLIVECLSKLICVVKCGMSYAIIIVRFHITVTSSPVLHYVINGLM